MKLLLFILLITTVIADEDSDSKLCFIINNGFLQFVYFVYGVIGALVMVIIAGLILLGILALLIGCGMLILIVSAGCFDCCRCLYRNYGPNVDFIEEYNSWNS